MSAAFRDEASAAVRIEAVTRKRILEEEADKARAVNADEARKEARTEAVAAAAVVRAAAAEKATLTAAAAKEAAEEAAAAEAMKETVVAEAEREAANEAAAETEAKAASAKLEAAALASVEAARESRKLRLELGHARDALRANGAGAVQMTLHTVEGLLATIPRSAPPAVTLQLALMHQEPPPAELATPFNPAASGCCSCPASPAADGLLNIETARAGVINPLPATLPIYTIHPAFKVPADDESLPIEVALTPARAQVNPGVVLALPTAEVLSEATGCHSTAIKIVHGDAPSDDNTLSVQAVTNDNEMLPRVDIETGMAAGNDLFVWTAGSIKEIIKAAESGRLPLPYGQAGCGYELQVQANHLCHDKILWHFKTQAGDYLTSFEQVIAHFEAAQRTQPKRKRANAVASSSQQTVKVETRSHLGPNQAALARPRPLSAPAMRRATPRVRVNPSQPLLVPLLP